mmetsp:Transcript_26635/g.68393  ORF Transcript_26635/g.68393 Transcript_26635/m.68393 type:complete len:205 (+) Transcript_26635:813-1427(+)
MAEYGWRRLLLISSVPTGSILLVLPFIPESPRFLLLKGRERKAFAVLKKVARRNNRPLPISIMGLLPHYKKEPVSPKNGFFKPLVLLFSKGMRRQTIVLWLLWFFCIWWFDWRYYFPTSIFPRQGHWKWNGIRRHISYNNRECTWNSAGGILNRDEAWPEEDNCFICFPVCRLHFCARSGKLVHLLDCGKHRRKIFLIWPLGSN